MIKHKFTVTVNNKPVFTKDGQSYPTFPRSAEEVGLRTLPILWLAITTYCDSGTEGFCQRQVVVGVYLERESTETCAGCDSSGED